MFFMIFFSDISVFFKLMKKSPPVVTPWLHFMLISSFCSNYYFNNDDRRKSKNMSYAKTSKKFASWETAAQVLQ